MLKLFYAELAQRVYQLAMIEKEERGLAPASTIRSTTRLPRSTVRPVTATWAPSRPNISAIERPMPRVDPDTRATLPCRRMGEP